MEKWFACPKCHSPLGGDHDKIYCTSCGSDWSVEDGVPIFADKDYYWQHVERNRFPALLKTARERDWRQAIRDHTSSWELEYACAKSRADFRFLLQLSEDSTVLDAGCGWGAISCLLAQGCGRLFALDRTVESAIFVKERARQEGIENLVAVGASVTKLPFPDEMFDAIILNGVLEWIGTPGCHQSALDRQKKVLAQSYRCLKKGGQLFIGIENRFGIQYLLGRKDEHTNIRFVTVLPRFPANCLSKLSCGCEYTTFTHSSAYLGRILSRTGFSQVCRYLLYPDYRQIRYIADLADSSSVRDVLKNARAASEKRLLRAALLLGQVGTFAGLHTRLAPAFGVVATK